MILIRQEQLDAFTTATQAGFERRLINALAEKFPQCRETHGEAALGATVQLGIERAKAHGLQAEPDVMRYLWLMLLFGSHWERDPQVAWAAAALASDGASADRMSRLWESADAWRLRVMGPKDSYFAAALRSLEGRSVEDLCKSPSRSQRDLLMQLAGMYPQKFKEVGEQPLYDLTRLAVQACQPFELVDRWAVVLMAELMFLFGAGFIADPLHPWAGQVLREVHTATVDVKLERLLRAGLQQIARTLA